MTVSRNIEDCHPVLRKLALKLVDECEIRGLKIKITDCVRDGIEQADCVRRGTSGLSYPYSHHNWGTAFDFCRNDGRGAYNNFDGFFDRVGLIGERLGLEWGGKWKNPIDKPHFQLPDWGTSTYILRKTYGSPSEFRKTWGDEMTQISQEEFDKMMLNWLERRKNLNVSDWAAEDVECAVKLGITDGKCPQNWTSRQETAAMITRAMKVMGFVRSDE